STVSISVTCPGCQKQLKVPGELIGHPVKCPSCKSKFTATGEDLAAVQAGVAAPGQSAPPPAEPEWSEPELLDEDEPARDKADRPRRRRKRKTFNPIRAAEAAVFWPAAGLMATGSLGVATTLLIILLGLLGIALGADANAAKRPGGSIREKE